jgi:hypothetical protein
MWVIVSPLCFHPLLMLWLSAIVSGNLPDLSVELLGSELLVPCHIHTEMHACKHFTK